MTWMDDYTYAYDRWVYDGELVEGYVPRSDLRSRSYLWMDLEDEEERLRRETEEAMYADWLWEQEHSA